MCPGMVMVACPPTILQASCGSCYDVMWSGYVHAGTHGPVLLVGGLGHFLAHVWGLSSFGCFSGGFVWHITPQSGALVSLPSLHPLAPAVAHGTLLRGHPGPLELGSCAWSCAWVVGGFECANLCAQRGVPGSGYCNVDPVGSWFGMLHPGWCIVHVCHLNLIARTHQCAHVPAFRRLYVQLCIPILCLPCMHACCLMMVLLFCACLHS
jgi:hypothetical protein